MIDFPFPDVKQEQYLRFQLFTNTGLSNIACSAITYLNGDYVYNQINIIAAPNAHGVVSVVLPVGSGVLVSASMRLNNFSEEGHCYFGSIMIISNPLGTNPSNCVLSSGPVGWVCPLSWTSGASNKPILNRGFNLDITVVSAAGASPTYTIPFRMQYILRSIFTVLTTDGTAGNRVAWPVITNATPAPVANYVNELITAAGSISRLTFAPSCVAAFTTGEFCFLHMPPSLLEFGDIVSLYTDGIKAGDAYTNTVFRFEVLGTY